MVSLEKKTPNRKVLITGSAGFIGFHISQRLLNEGWKVCGVDAITKYYDPKLKLKRNEILKKNQNYFFKKENLENKENIKRIYDEFDPEVIIHLAAQAGVRYSIQNPQSFLDSNIIGTFNVLEAAKDGTCRHFLFASTSSVYGGNFNIPYKEGDKADQQLSFYAATKKSCESISHVYSHIYGLPITCFRFFTVYGPWGRPDMALFNFTRKIINGEPIDVFNHGKMKRDFTYIDDLVESVYRLIEIAPKKNGIPNINSSNYGSSMVAPWRSVNIGNAKPVELSNFIKILEKKLGKKASKNYIELQAGDVVETFADTNLLEKLIHFKPNTSVEKGIEAFLNWFHEYQMKEE